MKTGAILAGLALTLAASQASAADLSVHNDPVTPPAGWHGGATGVFGDISVSLGVFSYDDGYSSGWVSLGGNLIVPVGANGWKLALSSFAEYDFNGDTYFDLYGGAYKTHAAGAVGAFVGVDDSGSIRADLRAAAYTTRAIIAASVGGYWSSQYVDDVHVHGSVDYFVNPDLDIRLHHNFRWYDDGDTRFNIALYGEKRITGTPVSVFGDVQGEWTNSTSSDYSKVSAMIGVRKVFGGAPGTLQDYRRENPFLY